MNEPTITVYHNTPLEEIIRQLDELGLLDKPKNVKKEFRWYYDDHGNITGSCVNPADAEMYGFVGKYIIVDETIYNDFIKYRVLNDKPALIKSDSGQRRQLEKSNSGFTVVKNNAAILLEPTDTYKNTENYDYKNY